MRRIIVACTLGVFLLAGWSLAVRAQQPPRGIERPSVAHATSQPLTSYKGTTHLKGGGEARVMPLRQPEKPGGGGPGAAPPAGGGSWSDADVQSSYPSSQFTVGKVFQAFTFSGYLPPDENLSVGVNSEGGTPQTQIVSVVNTSYRVFDTSGNLLVQGDLATNLFGNFTGSVCSSEDGGDPIALYDRLDHRWLLSQLAYNGTFTDNHLCLAISKTSDATGAYDLYDISFGSSLPDYPKLGVWSDGIYFSANIFSGNSGALLFQGAQACSFPRSAVATSPASITFTCSPGTDATVYNILPADLEGTTLPPSGAGPDYFLQYADNLTANSGNLLRLYQLQGNSLNLVANLTVNDFHDACGGGTCIPQAGTTQLLDSLGDRLMYRLSYRNYGAYQQLVANHAVQVDSGGNQTGIRWYAIRNNPGGSPPFAVYKESTFSPDASTYRWMGSIGQNKDGDLGLGYSTSGVTGVPGIAVTGLLNGTDTYMEQEQVLYPGKSYQGTYSRWGDYSSVSVDPTDDCTFWYTNEYVTPPVLSFDFLWQTVIGSFSFPGCGSTGSGAYFSVAPNPSTQTVTQGGSTSYTITVTSVNSYHGTVNLGYSGCPAGATCTLPSSVAVAAGSFATATLNVSNTGGTTPGNYTISLTGTDSVDTTLKQTTSVGLTVNAPPNFSVGASPASQTITQGGSTTYTVTVTSLNNYSNGSVGLSASGCPLNATCSFSPTSVSVPANGSANSTLSVATNGSIAATSYTIGVSASDGTLTHSTSVGLTVTQAASGNFSLSASPGSLTLKTGQTGSYTVSVSPTGGFSSDVTVSANCPSGFLCGFSPGNVIGGGSGSVSYSVTNNSAPRRSSYTITLTASGGSQTHQTSVALKSR